MYGSFYSSSLTDISTFLLFSSGFFIRLRLFFYSVLVYELIDSRYPLTLPTITHSANHHSSKYQINPLLLQPQDANHSQRSLPSLISPPSLHPSPSPPLRLLLFSLPLSSHHNQSHHLSTPIPASTTHPLLSLSPSLPSR